MLLAMATGTGKTKLAIAMLYRLLAAKRFRRGGAAGVSRCATDTVEEFTCVSGTAAHRAR